MDPKGKQANDKGHMGLRVEIEHGFSFSFLAAKHFSEGLFVTEILSLGSRNVFQQEKNVSGSVFLGRG